MKKLILEGPSPTISLDEIDIYEKHIIFAQNTKGKLCGMVITDHEGQTLKIGALGSNGHYKTLTKYLNNARKNSFTLLVEEL